MKIRINEKESYEIETNDELSQEEFFIFKDRINTISKLMKDPFSQTSLGMLPESMPKQTRPYKTRIPGRKRRPGILSTISSREEAIETVKLFYSDKELLNERYKSINRDGLLERSGDTKLMNKEMMDLRRKYNIHPNELGLIRLPNSIEMRENNLEHLKIKNGIPETKKEETE